MWSITILIVVKAHVLEILRGYILIVLEKIEVLYQKLVFLY